MGLSRLLTGFIVFAFASLSTPATVSAEFSDDPLDFGEFEPTRGRHSGTDPNVSRLFFMPTFETLPQGKASIGTMELLSVHGSFSPLNSIQIGGAIVPWAPGIASIGAKVRLWRSADQHAGVAVGGNYTSLNWGLDRDDYDALTTGYMVAGYSSNQGQIHAGLFVMETRSEDYVNFMPPPEPDFSSSRHVEKEQHVFGALGFSAPIQGNTHAMLELWGIGVDDNWPIAFPGFRFFEHDTSFEAILTPVWYDDGEFHLGLPIFNITHHFR